MGISDLRTMLQSASDGINSVERAASEAATLADLANKKAAIDLGTATLSIAGPVILSLAPITRTMDVPPAKVGDLVAVHRVGPAKIGASVIAQGCAVFTSGYVSADGKVEVTLIIPAISVGAALTIPLSFRALRNQP